MKQNDENLARYTDLTIMSKSMESTPSTPCHPVNPLQLSGFLSGDTIQVQGDTANLQFSIQFNFHHKEDYYNAVPFPDLNPAEIQTPFDPMSSPSSYATPDSISTPDNKDQEHNWTIQKQQGNNDNGERGIIVTRLRSGILSPVDYSPRSYRVFQGALIPRNRKRRKNKGRGEVDLLERILERRSYPIKPCNSYSFFVMATWDKVKHSSFGETSKRLSKIWSKLSHDEKKVFQDMASKDDLRYKRQCILLRNDAQEEARINDQNTDVSL
ncbi:uncharacterized protein LOC132052781 [Lycium ferocissimum]|uniref:uncharacterized protein LOC132052781 n=1 Tax=Lycium ferocissimum TaxID=112874 RepID=UPI0028161B32|nr:uncharacterized protein LOC132052781 [Lycium ferocissimum]